MDEPALSIEPVVGFRTWLLTADRELRSVVKQHIWGDGPAVCIEPFRRPLMAPAGHRVPAADCECGYWLLDSYPRLQQTTVCWYGATIKSVRGVAIGWGRTVVCERGWRVERAAPAALLNWPERRADVRSEFTELSDIAAEWNDICEETAEALSLPLMADADDLMAYAEELRERGLTLRQVEG